MTRGRYGFLLLIALMAFAGCGMPNDQASFDPDTGKHPSDWVYAKHAVASKENTSACMECHGSDLAGGVTGQSCGRCHLKGSPLTVTGCTSCHGNPPTGTVAPNRSLSHPAHNALPNNAKECSNCHSGAGTGTVNHYNAAVEVVFLSAYNAKSGAAVRNADGTCSKVSCHGGQTTPLWTYGIIDVNTQCTACHAYGTAEYNGFSSGRHSSHVFTHGFTCTDCHDTAKLVVSHFTGLDTSAMEGPASATLHDSLHYNGVSCMLTCHGTRIW
jgi:predicted CxxxxCH...CXXCH cytochrome family protein